MDMAVFLCARDLDGVGIGVHQMILVIPDSMSVGSVFQRINTVVHTLEVAPNIFGFILAGYQDGELLKLRINESSDVEAVGQVFGNAIGDTDWDASIRRIVPKQSEMGFMWRILRAAENYILHTDMNPISYSFFWKNCNMLAGSLIQAAGGSVNNDFPGLDLSHARRFPMHMFED